MNNRSILWGASAAVLVAAPALLSNIFSRISEAPLPQPVELALAEEAVLDAAPCTVTISTASPDSTKDLVNVVRAYLKDAGLLQDFTGADDFHAYMENVYKGSIDAEDTADELDDAKEMIVKDEACHTVEEPGMNQCTFAEAQKLYQHLEALQIYPTDGSIDWNALSPAQQYTVVNATTAFANMVTGVYPSLAQQVWPDNSIGEATASLYTRFSELENSSIPDGVCVMPIPVEAAPAPAPTEQGPATPRRKSTPGMTLHA